MIKYFITDYKKVNLYGDLDWTENGAYYRFRGKALKVKIANLFWITYRLYLIK